VRRRRLAGDLRPLEAGRETLQECAEEWWRLYAVPNLARTTLASYASLWDAHVLPRLGATPLRELDPLSLSAFRVELTAAGVGPASVRRVMVTLQGVLERAVEWQRITANPARAVRKPPQRRERAVRPLSPLASNESERTSSTAGAYATPCSSRCSRTPGSDQGRRSR
jgi:integrase